MKQYGKTKLWTMLFAGAIIFAGCGDSSGGSANVAATGNGGILGGSNATSNGTSDLDAGNSDDGGADEDSGTPDASETDEFKTEILLDGETITLSNGFSPGTSFEVPENVVSITVTVEGDDRTFYSLASWDGNGQDLVRSGWLNTDPTAPQICSSCDNRVSASSGVMATIAPNNPNAVVEPGTHRVSVFGFTQSGVQGRPANGDAKVTAIAKVLPDEPTAGVIDFNMHFTGAGGWSSRTVDNDPIFQQMMEDVATIYAQVGLTVGNVTYKDIDTNFRIIENIAQDDSDLQLLFSQSEGNEANAVNVFFVSELAAFQGGGGPGFGLILGVAGGIPGPPLLQGSTRSGVAVAVESHSEVEAFTDLANTFAHEVGHFLGLFHTSEQNLGGGEQLHDPLDDTPNNDRSYLMHNSGAGSTLSPWQGRVMRINPWVRHAR